MRGNSHERHQESTDQNIMPPPPNHERPPMMGVHHEHQGHHGHEGRDESDVEGIYGGRHHGRHHDKKGKHCHALGLIITCLFFFSHMWFLRKLLHYQNEVKELGGKIEKKWGCHHHCEKKREERQKRRQAQP